MRFLTSVDDVLGDVFDTRDVVKLIADLQPLACQHCGESVLPNNESPTGYVHDEYDDELNPVLLCARVQTGDDPTRAEPDEDEAEEFSRALKLESELQDATGEYVHGEAVIAEGYFEDYARQFAEDIGALPDDASWPVNRIDWEAAANDLKADYTSIDFEGSTYYVRSS